MTRVAVITAAMLSACVAAPSAAQQQPSLAEIARQTEASRANGKKAAKSYTNASLGAQPDQTKDDEPPSGYISQSLGRAVSEEELIERSQQAVEQRNGMPESYWRQQSDYIRKEADRALKTIEAYRRPVDSPALEAANKHEIARMQQMLQLLEKQWAKLERNATAAKANPDWIGPRPNFTP